MESQRFNGDRLKEALVMREKKMTELAAETGIKKQSLSLYANGGNIPPFDNVVKIAKSLMLPVDYFMSDDRCKVRTSNTYFRSQASATKKVRSSQQIKLEYISRMYNVLAEYVNFPELNLPNDENFTSLEDISESDYDKMYDRIETIASKVRDYWGIGDGPIDNLQYILESNGIVVTGIKGVDSSVDAFSQQINIDGRQVYIIALAIGEKSRARLRFDMAHELGHILMHAWGDDSDSITKEEFNLREWQADVFAGAFLLPRNSFSKSVAAYPSNVEFYISLKRKWQVSMQAMMYRAKHIGLISLNQFQYMMRIMSKNGWRKNEPGDVIGELNDTIFQGSIDILVDGGFLTADKLVRNFSDCGINFYRDDLENLMCLKKGTLESKDNIVPFISIKK